MRARVGYNRSVGPADSADRDELEAAIREHAAAGRFQSAATLGLEGYGPEVFGYLRAVTPDPDDADEHFSVTSEQVWRGLPNFRFQSTFRTWFYAIARNIVSDHRRAAVRRRQRFADGARSSAVEAVAARIRSTTAIHLRTQTKTKLSEIRDTLDPDDRTLLVLRLDRGMSWNEIATVLAEESNEGEDAARASARIRKRFERIKARVAAELRAGEAAP